MKGGAQYQAALDNAGANPPMRRETEARSKGSILQKYSITGDGKREKTGIL